MIKYYNGEMCIIPKEFEEEIRADERQKILEEVKHKAQKLIHPEYDERDEFFNDGVQLVIDIIDDYGREEFKLRE